MNKIFAFSLGFILLGSAHAQQQTAQQAAMAWKQVTTASTFPSDTFQAPDGAEVSRGSSLVQLGLQERPEGLWIRVMQTKTLERVRIADKKVDSVRASSTIVNGIVAQLLVPKNAELSLPELWAGLWTAEAVRFLDSGGRERLPVTAAILGRVTESFSAGKYISAEALKTKVPPAITDTIVDVTYPIDPEYPDKGQISGLQKLMNIQRAWVKQTKGNSEKVSKLPLAPSNASPQELDRGQLAPEEGSSLNIPDFKSMVAVVGRCLNPRNWFRK